MDQQVKAQLCKHEDLSWDVNIRGTVGCSDLACDLKAGEVEAKGSLEHFGQLVLLSRSADST